MEPLIRIEKVEKVGAAGLIYKAIANDGKDYAPKISKTILERAADGWGGKTKLYFNPDTNKWVRYSDTNTAGPKPSKKSKSKLLSKKKIGPVVYQNLIKIDNQDGSITTMATIPGGGFGSIKWEKSLTN